MAEHGPIVAFHALEVPAHLLGTVGVWRHLEEA
jgi:hypothetical protein